MPFLLIFFLFLFVQQQIIVFVWFFLRFIYNIDEKSLTIEESLVEEREIIFQLTHVEKQNIGFVFVVFVVSACLVVFKTICVVYFWVNICYECLGKSVGFGGFFFVVCCSPVCMLWYFCLQCANNCCWGKQMAKCWFCLSKNSKK